MSIYVYLTEQCIRDINQQRYEGEVDGFRRKIESSQNMEVFDRFPPPFLKKRFERQIRLVARDYFVGPHVVVAFLRLLVRGGNEYSNFGDTGYKELPGFQRMVEELKEENLLKYVEGRQDPMPSPPPIPDESEELYLHSALSLSENIYQDYHCCETKLWVDAMSSSHFEDYRSLFVDPVFETIDSTETGLVEVRCKKDRNFGILFRRIPEQKMVILLTPFKGAPPLESVHSKYSDLLIDGTPNAEVVLKRTKRAYPHELLLNPEAWLQVQKDQDGNMALSLEEIDVLESARKPDGGFPLFINGSAGSGKSTILQYLFSEYVFHHLESGLSTKGPVLFACNDELLARTMTSVNSILRARHGRKSSNSQSFEQWIDPFNNEVSGSLRNFHRWLRSLISGDDFRHENLFDYGRFKLWWEKRFQNEPAARNLYNADISWHVIRTYIKGISPEGILEPDDYLEIPSKQKSVTPETYQIVFDKVWKRYQEDQKEYGYWDNQDLARHVLEREIVIAEHPVVFCDEAQDFTRIELEVLHRCCLFHSRTLNSFQLPQIPMAFAGDPFQTLNPTGFRWEATKAFFTEKFIRTFPGQRTRELNYQELTYNYRSSHHIVRFNNSLQLLRSVVFNFPEIKPQKPWDEDGDVPNVSYYERSDIDVLNTLKNQSEIRIIVPCDEGYEGVWAKENGLADYVEFDDAGVPKNVVSPTGVKGLEFPRVVLFGFGGACPPSLKNAITDSSAELTDDQAIEPQYFLNHLYVAASRPRKRLFVIDSEADIKGFWNQIFTNQETLILRAQNAEPWEGKTGQIIKGSQNTWEGDREDPAETAEKLEKEGHLRKDRVLLRQAAQSYLAAKMTSAASRCRAEALELEQSFLEAAKLWQDLKEYDRSLSAAWKLGGGGFNFIIRLAEARPDLKNRIHWKFSSFLTSKGGINEGVTLIKDFEGALLDAEIHTEVISSTIWPAVIESGLTQILESEAKETGLWRLAYKNALLLVHQGVRVPIYVLGEMAFRADQMQEAYAHWETILPADRAKFEQRFLRAKAVMLPYPQNLDVLGELLGRHKQVKDASEILALVQREGREKLSDVQLAILARASLLTGDFEGAFKDISKLQDISLLVDLLDSAYRRKADVDRISSLRRILETISLQERWQEILELLKNGQAHFVQINSMQQLAKQDPVKHAIPFIEFLASNSDIEGARNDFKTDISMWLRKYLTTDFSWRHDVHPLLVGRAFERAGLFRETLPYYESLGGSSIMSAAVRNLAWQRWAKTKALQASHERERNSKGRADKLLNEALEKVISTGLPSLEAIPEELPHPLPGVDPIPSKATKNQASRKAAEAQTNGSDSIDIPSPVVGFSRELQLGRITIRVSPDGNRVNILHSDSFEQASMFIARKSVQVEGEEIIADSAGRFIIDQWKLVVCFNQANEGKIVFLADDGLELTLPVARPDI